MIIYKNDAILFDKPVDDDSTKELVEILETHKVKIKGLVINHFHEDCLGGLTYLHKKGIKSYANDKTILFAKNDSVTIPLNGFTDKLVLRLGKKKYSTSLLARHIH